MLKLHRTCATITTRHRTYVIGHVIDRKQVNRWRPEFRADAHKTIHGRGLSRHSLGRTGVGVIRIDRRYL